MASVARALLLAIADVCAVQDRAVKLPTAGL
jgi:hypothetical protein